MSCEQRQQPARPRAIPAGQGHGDRTKPLPTRRRYVRPQVSAPLRLLQVTLRLGGSHGRKGVAGWSSSIAVHHQLLTSSELPSCAYSFLSFHIGIVSDKRQTFLSVPVPGEAGGGSCIPSPEWRWWLRFPWHWSRFNFHKTRSTAGVSGEELQKQQSHLTLLKSPTAKHCRPRREPFRQPGLRRVVGAASLPSSASLDASLDASSDAKHDLEEGPCLPPCIGAVQRLHCRCRRQITQISSSHDGSVGLEELPDSSAAVPSLMVARLQESISPASRTPFASEHSSGPARGARLGHAPHQPTDAGCAWPVLIATLDSPARNRSL